MGSLSVSMPPKMQVELEQEAKDAGYSKLSPYIVEILSKRPKLNPKLKKNEEGYICSICGAMFSEAARQKFDGCPTCKMKEMEEKKEKEEKKNAILSDLKKQKESAEKEVQKWSDLFIEGKVQRYEVLKAEEKLRTINERIEEVENEFAK